MRSVTLLGTGITTTALGFGTSTLMGRLSRKESLRLLEVAYDRGIRHFDTAPLYGYGESEAVVGAFLRKHDDVTVATKFGILRPRGSSFLFRRAKEIGRPLLRAFPQLRERARRAAQSGITDVANFDPVAGAASLATSLRRLHRDRIDLFFLHECREPDLRDERLLHFLIDAKARGLVRAFGIATDIATIEACLRSAPAFAPVVQFPNNRAEPNLERLPELSAERPCITHSPFGGYGNRSTENIEAALRYATAQNPNGIILFSSQQPGHIAANVEAFATCSTA